MLLLPIKWSRLRKPILVFSVILIGLLGGHNTPVQGFYLSGNNSNETRYEYERMHSKWHTSKRTFSMYDYLHRIDNYNIYISPTVSQFIPMDIIECNIPLNLSLMQSVSLDGTIENMLYANLKLKNLLDEYNALQKEIKALKEKQKASPGPSIFSFSIDTRPSSIHRRTQKMTQTFAEAQSKTGIDAENKHNIGVMSVSQTNFENVQSSQVQSPKKTIDAFQKTAKKVSEVNASQRSENNAERIQELELTQRSIRQSRESEPSLLVEFLMAFLNYCMKNPFEAIFLGMILFLLLKLIFSIFVR